MISHTHPRYRWYILAVAMLSYAMLTGASRLCMPVLFKQISEDLNLSVVDVGFIWGMDPLAGVFIGLPGGLLADRFGVKRTLIVLCVFAGLFGALRGLTVDFFSMAAVMFLFGLTVAAAPSIVPKATAEWFGGRQLALANALLNIAWGLGAVVASMISATVLAPAFGSWRWVMLFYGIPTAMIGLLWATTREPPAPQTTEPAESKVPFKQALSHVARLKEVWIIGIITTALWGATMGFLGYLPLYLRNIGWTPAAADSVITMFNAVNAIGVIPMTLLSNHIGSRKTVVFISALSTVLALAFLPLVNSTGVWILVIACGFLRSGASALFTVMVFEIEGVGSKYGGTATGLANSVSMLGAFLGPPLGNSFARFGDGYPFFFWAVLAALPLPLLLFVRNRTGQSHARW
ncbi:MAG: MFS transporter [Dehalococcoidales bacterium]|nr:MFS transporter [Dehalococcoidales bacterium]